MYKKLSFLSVILAVVVNSTFTAEAASLIHFDPTRPNSYPHALDTTYNDGESTIYTATSNDLVLTATLSGRDYMQDPLAGEEWGLIDNSTPGNDGRPGWIVRQGWESTTLGVPTNNHPDDPATKAAYLLITLDHQDDVVFDTVDVTIDQPVSTEFIQVWGSTNADGFADYVVGNVVRLPNEEFMTISFAGLNYDGTDPLQIRIYGVIGEDDGTFGVRIATGVTPVPEPSSTVLLLAMAGLWASRRKRSK
jgi:hypothetical protein